MSYWSWLPMKNFGCFVNDLLSSFPSFYILVYVKGFLGFFLYEFVLMYLLCMYVCMYVCMHILVYIHCYTHIFSRVLGGFLFVLLMSFFDLSFLFICSQCKCFLFFFFWYVVMSETPVAEVKYKE